MADANPNAGADVEDANPVNPAPRDTVPDQHTDNSVLTKWLARVTVGHNGTGCESLALTPKRKPCLPTRTC